MHDPGDLRDLVADELRQRAESGHDVGSIAGDVRAALSTTRQPDDRVLAALLDRLEAAPRMPDWPFAEPQLAAEIEAALPIPAAPGRRAPADDEQLADRIHGAWLGRTAGCMVGKPVEGWSHLQIRAYLEPMGAYPPDDYLPRAEPWPDTAPAMKPSWPSTTRGRVRGAARDDDVDYTILNLHLLEAHGRSFTTDDVAGELLDHLPFTRVYTAERAAYRNLVAGLRAPQSALVRNPYREWIGALIRADAYGYVSPGRPLDAVRLAARDASVSHAGNGISAAMWAAALLAECLVSDSVEDAFTASLSFIAPGTRLSEALHAVAGLRRSGSDWEGCRVELERRYADYAWVHAVNNAATIAAALLWGDGDLARSVGLAVAAGLDTDSTAATVGSACGAVLGASRLPARLIEPLEDRLRSDVVGFDGARISELAARTVRLARTPADGDHDAPDARTPASITPAAAAAPVS